MTFHTTGDPAHHLDLSDQVEDINSIGVSEPRFPMRTVAIVVVGLSVLLVVAVFVAKRWVESSLPTSATVRKREELPFTNSSTGKVNLPDANTPLGDDGGMTDVAQTKVSEKPQAQRQQKNENCRITQLVDKSTGKVVRDPQTGQPVSVNCNGTLQVPAPQTGTAGTEAKNRVSFEGNTVAVVDRYSGDTTLAPKKSTSLGLGGGVGSATATTPVTSPPPSSMVETLLRMNGGGARGAGSASDASTNPILSSGQGGGTANTQGAIGGGMLSSTSTPKAMAVRSLDANLTIPKGGAIDCNMTTRVVTEISGFTSCIVSENVYSANGRVLLIERMSEVQGEYAAVGQPGQRRVYVLWSRIRKPDGITIDINSPSTDSLGAAGIDGVVDNRWFERIGSAYMLSIFKDFLAANAASQVGTNGANGSVLYQNSMATSNSLAEKVLSQSMNIKPVVYANQGARVSIYVARDLDFSPVYDIKHQ